MTEKMISSTLHPSGDKEGNTNHAGPSTLPVTAVIGECSLSAMCITPHTRHREFLAMGTSATSSGGGSVLAAPPPISMLPFPSPVDSVRPSFPQQQQTATPKTPFLSHSFSRDENAMKRLEERDNQKKISETNSHRQKSGASTPSVSTTTPLCISPGNTVERRETEHTKQRRESGTSRGFMWMSAAASEPSSALLPNFSSHPTAFRSPLEENEGGRERREWNQHQDPHAMFGALSNSAPSGKIGLLGNAYPFSPFSVNNNSVMAQDSGGVSRARMGVSPTLDGVGARVPSLPTENNMVELPMRLRRGVGMGISLPTSVCGGGGESLPSYPRVSPFTSSFGAVAHAFVASAEGGVTALLPSAEAEKGGSSGRRSGEGERATRSARGGIVGSGGATCRPTPHAQLREDAAEMGYTSSSSLSLLEDSTSDCSSPKETKAFVKGKGGIVEVVAEGGEKSKELNEDSKVETSSQASGTMRSIEDAPSRFPGNRTLSPQHESSPFSSLQPGSENHRTSLMVNYWKSKNALQSGKQAVGMHQERDIPVGGFSAPVGFGPVFPSCVSFSKEEEVQHGKKEGSMQCHTNRSGFTVSSIYQENNADSSNAREAERLKNSTHCGNTLDKEETFSPFSLATSVPAYYRARPSLKSASNGSLPRQDDSDAAARMRSTLPPQGASPLFAAPMSSSLGGAQKRATMHAVLRDRVCTEDGGVLVAETRQTLAGDAPAKMDAYVTSSSGKAEVGGGSKERTLPASDWNTEEIESGEYAT